MWNLRIKDFYFSKLFKVKFNYPFSSYIWYFLIEFKILLLVNFGSKPTQALLLCYVRLGEEYDQKPSLVPPFVVLEDLYKLVKGIWKLSCRKKRENLDSYMQEYLDALDLFEKNCMTEYLAIQVIQFLYKYTVKTALV